MNCYVCNTEFSARNRGTKYSCNRCAKKLQREKSLTHVRVAAAIKKGNLPRVSLGEISCVDCGEQATCYDHRDYRKPLDVQPVCEGCDAKRGMGEPYRSIMAEYLRKKIAVGEPVCGKTIQMAGLSTSAWQSWELGRRKIPVDFVLVLPKEKK